MSAQFPKNGVAYTFFVALEDQANPGLFKANPTLAAGDVKVSKDGGSFNNITTLPSAAPASGRALQVDLSATEMTCDNIVVQFVDAAGAEWFDLIVNIQPQARALGDLAFPTVSGRGLDVSTGGEAGVDWANVGSPTTAVDLSGTTIKTTQKVDVDTIKTNPVVNGGTVTFPTNSTLASTQNITAATGVNVSTMGANSIGVGAFAAGAITPAAVATDAIDADALAADAVTKITDAVLALAVETGLTLKNALRLIAAASAGKLSGAATSTVTIRNAVADTKDRIVATVDADGNRSAIVTDLT